MHTHGFLHHYKILDDNRAALFTLITNDECLKGGSVLAWFDVSAEIYTSNVSFY